MEYGNVIEGRFLARPNRFIARVEVGGREEDCHVKNTGRCRELLVPGARVWLEEGTGAKRKTKYDLIAVQKGERLINMDSQAPNKVAAEYLPRLLPGLTLLRAEQRYGASRFDFYAEAGAERWFIEVKGVTLEEDGVVLFPDAPTQRGVKHLRELCAACGEGYRAMVLFVVQMEGVRYFTPNTRTHPQFAEALAQAQAQGVRIEAVDCQTAPGTLCARGPVEVRLISSHRPGA